MNRSIVTLFLFAVSVARAQAPSTSAAPASPLSPANPAFVRPQANYPIPYAPPTVAEIKAVLDRVHGYLDRVTPTRVVDRNTNQEISDRSTPNANATIARGDFSLTSYEWGVTYAGMLLATEVTGDKRFANYTAQRLKFLAEAVPFFRAQAAATDAAAGSSVARMVSLRQVIAPRSLDDSGSMCAAMIKAQRAGGVDADLHPLINNYIDWITTKQFRLPDGTLARNRPLANALWLDDLFMSVPALAQMGKLTGEAKYHDDAVRQILQFGDRMFVREKGLFMHGWIQEMNPHPAFHWARANGWAIMAMAELLEVLPADHPGRAKVLDLYRAHVRGIVVTQGGNGLWHQVLDRNDSYLETSASAIFVYSITRGINRGWLEPRAYGPPVALGWNAVVKKVNDQGQVEGTCIGTGMAFDPMFYYYRPVSVYAAHGYGPVLLAGAEMIAFRQGKGKDALISDGAIQMERSPSNF
jgi:rhamnogalacturonyl hydrolase YesR